MITKVARHKSLMIVKSACVLVKVHVYLLVVHVDADDVSGRSHELGENERVCACAAVEVKHVKGLQLVGRHQTGAAVPVG